MEIFTRMMGTIKSKIGTIKSIIGKSNEQQRKAIGGEKANFVKA